jgi:phosphopantetheine adenylyltransferase
MDKLVLSIPERQQLAFLLQQNINQVEADVLDNLDAGRKRVAAMLIEGIKEMQDLHKTLLKGIES